MSRSLLILVCILAGLTTVSAQPIYAREAPEKKLLLSFLNSRGLNPADIVQANVPAIGCPADGQMGFTKPPQIKSNVTVTVLRGTAPHLAFYTVDGDLRGGVLAPRNWRCFGTYGSGGSALYVTPVDVNAPILERPRKIADDAAVTWSMAHGDTSGRFTVAKVSARIFPGMRRFVEEVRDEGLGDPDDYVFKPWPGDVLTRLSETVVNYTTPAGMPGLGTEMGLAPSRSDAVSGFVALHDLSLQHLSVRLAGIHATLSDSIQVAMLARLQTEAPETESMTALATVTAFYEALGLGDGFRASQFIVPEKRATGPFAPDAMTRFYSRLRFPLRLQSISQIDASSVHAWYHYEASNNNTCNGEAIVHVKSGPNGFLIERIQALSKC